MKAETNTLMAAKRRLVILALLHQSSHFYQNIIEKLINQQLFSSEQVENELETDNRIYYAFRRDIETLRLMGCEILSGGKTKPYQLLNSPFKLRLNEIQLTTFSLLRDTFKETAFPHASEIRTLLDYLLELLPETQQHLLARGKHSFSIDLRETSDYRKTNPRIISDIEKAVRLGQQLEFKYSPTRDGQVRQHVVEPRPMIFKDGHVYFYGYSLRWQREYQFRLEGVVEGSTKVLPTRNHPTRPAPVTHTLRYRVDPQIARNGVSQHFDNQREEQHPDGSVTVTAETTDLFKARRLLLAYGSACQVIEPPQLVAEMQQTARSLYQMYCTNEN